MRLGPAVLQPSCAADDMTVPDGQHEIDLARLHPRSLCVEYQAVRTTTATMKASKIGIHRDRGPNTFKTSGVVHILALQVLNDRRLDPAPDQFRCVQVLGNPQDQGPRLWLATGPFDRGTPVEGQQPQPVTYRRAVGPCVPVPGCTALGIASLYRAFDCNACGHGAFLCGGKQYEAQPSLLPALLCRNHRDQVHDLDDPTTRAFRGEAWVMRHSCRGRPSACSARSAC